MAMSNFPSVYSPGRRRKKNDENNVGDAAKKVRRCWEPLGYVCDAKNDRDGYRFDVVGRRVFDLPHGKGVRVEGLIQAGIRAPHIEECLCNFP